MTDHEKWSEILRKSDLVYHCILRTQDVGVRLSVQNL